MKMYSKEGVEMVEVRSVELAGDHLLLKTKVMGSMTATIVLHPRDLWEALGLLKGRLLWRLPGLLFKGWREHRQRTHSGPP
ncbi:hypothetical protein [Caldimonas thermodepolymerans]|jgi:hypothetical protein|uniref:hypothetical protein n=1 Tax=Caldimonas thermodepolymerans TaxID=215580 RepID=UPI002235523D|nr:hypothetical protein [Caldimonas thermodepolymerans]UZG46088.1 hypothetical protein ONZ46_09145 [Caldimonas thermodepolymerans]